MNSKRFTISVIVTIIVLTGILAIAKLLDFIDWPWQVVLAPLMVPLWIFSVIVIIIVIVYVIETIINEIFN